MSALTKYLGTNRRAEPEGPTLSPEFIEQVLGKPKAGVVAIANARQAALSLEEDRKYTVNDVRAERLLRLLERCLPYVMESRQGRGDLELERLIRLELR